MPVSLLDLPSGEPFAAILRNPLVVSPDTPVLETITQMSHLTARGVSPPSTTHHLRANCAVVMDQQQVMGIFTEQDVVYLTAQQQPLKGVTIGEVMTQPVITLTEAAFTDLSVAAQQLQQHQIRHLPVVDGQGALIGVVTYESLHHATQQRLRWEQTARQQAEVQFQASEQRCASLVATAPVGIFHADAEGNCIYVNDCWSQITGVSLDAALGEGWQQGLHPEDRDRIVLAWNQATTNQHLFQFEYRFQHGNGAVRWVKGQSAVERDAQGQILGYVGTITDITEHKETEAALAASEAHQRALFSALPDLILRVSQTGIYLEFVTHPDFAVVGNLAELVGTHVSESLPPPIASQRLAVIERALQTRSTQIYEQDLSTPNNIQIEEVRVVPCGADEVLLLVRDISDRQRLEAERQQAQAALRLSEQTNRTIVEAMPDLLIRMDRAGYYHQMAGGSSVQVKYPVAAPASEPDLYRVLPTALAEQRLAFAHQALETGQLQVYEQPFEVDGDQRWEEVRIAPLTDQEVLIIIRDVTERTRLEAERKRTLVALEASEQRFRQLFEATPQIPVQGYDRDRQVIYWNPASEQLYGYSSTEALGQKLENLIIPPEMRESVVAAVEDWVTGGADIPASELTLMDKQGHPVEVFSSHVMLNNLAGEPELYCVDIEIGAVKRAEATLQNLIRGTAATTGQDFFPVLVGHIADALDVAYAIVTERVGDQLQTLALWAQGALQPNFAYLAAPTPCGQALRDGELYCAHSVQQQFPDCTELVEMGAESYLGIALRNAQGEAIGNLCIYHHQPISDPRRAEQILRVFAARATAELERQQATTALEKLNQTLEAKVIERTAALEEREARYRALVNVIPDLLIRIDADGTYLDVITGGGVELFNPDQIDLGVNIYDVTPFAHAQERMDYVHQAIQTREVQSYDYDLTINGQKISETARIVAINDTEALVIVQDISERARLEAEVAERATALRASEAQLRAMIEAIPDLLLRVAPDGTCLSSMYPSDNSQAFLPVQRHLSEVLPPELLQQQLNAVERAVATGTLQVYEHHFQKGDCMVYEEVRVSAISADEVLLMVRDITQRKQIEKALHESQRFLQTVLDTVPLPVFWKDRNSVFLGGTQKLLDAVGLQSEADLIGKTDFDLAATQASAIAYRTDDQQVMESGIARLGIVETLTGPDGQQNWLETHKAPLRNWAGEVIGVVGIFQDITQRKQAEIALQTKTEELDRFFALALDMLCIVDDEGRFIHLNHRWEQALGHSLTEMQSSLYMDYVHPEDVESTLAASNQLAKDKAIFGFANRYRCRDGSYRWLEWYSVLSQGLIHATARDITDRKRVEAELKAKNNEIQRAYQDLKTAQLHLIQSEKMSSLGQLVAGIAHEINNPVSFIYGNLGMALNYAQDLRTVLALYQTHYAEPPQEITDFIETADINYVLEDFPKLLQSMENGAVRIRDIVASLRTFSHLDQAALKAADIHENIDSTLVILQNRLNGRAGKPEIQVIKAYGDLPMVECYSGLLNQVFMNLLVNAIDAIEERQATASPDYAGCITIETEQMAMGKFRVAIKDNGLGMSSSTQAKIFDPFYTTKPVGLGTGMGLSISYQIVTNNHQGQLTCHSVLGEGTEFTIEL